MDYVTTVVCLCICSRSSAGAKYLRQGMWCEWLLSTVLLGSDGPEWSQGARGAVLGPSPFVSNRAWCNPVGGRYFLRALPMSYPGARGGGGGGRGRCGGGRGEGNCCTCFFFLPCASPFAGGLGAGFGAGFGADFGTAICEGMQASSTKSLVKYNFPLKACPKPATPLSAFAHTISTTLSFLALFVGASSDSPPLLD